MCDNSTHNVISDLPVVEIIRIEESFQGTFGVLKINKSAFCVTLELSDLLNDQNKSCIPAQQYTCLKRQTSRHGITFEVTAVPHRSGILFHPGNTINDTSGCILLGSSFGKLYGNRAILNSGLTFKNFMSVFTNFKSFHLTITNHF
jgi:hypothetical protein